MPASLHRVVTWMDQALRTSQIEDWPGAQNGLQVQNNGTAHRIAALVDASHATLQLAIEQKADLVIAHHGLFWSPTHPWTGKRYQLLRLLFDHNVAVYSSHLPLDIHPRLGNNAKLAHALGLRNGKPFFQHKGRALGLQFTASLHRKELGDRLRALLGADPLLIPGGPPKCRRIGVVTGGAGDQLALAAGEGIDTFITGEGPHWTYALAEDLGVNVFYGGHYATEVFGVRALAAEVSRRFRIPWSFVDYPTGL